MQIKRFKDLKKDKVQFQTVLSSGCFKDQMQEFDYSFSFFSQFLLQEILFFLSIYQMLIKVQSPVLLPSPIYLRSQNSE